MMMEREGRALSGASPESRESAPERSLQEGRRDSDICASPSSPTASREIPGLVPSGTNFCHRVGIRGIRVSISSGKLMGATWGHPDHGSL